MKRLPISLLSSLALATLTSACGSSPKPAPVVEPPPVVEPAPEPLPRLPGDDQVPDAYRRDLGNWLKSDDGKIYQRVLEVREVSNAVSIVMERKVQLGNECLIGPSTLDIMYPLGQDGQKAETATIDIQHFGQDCCPGTTCEMLPTSWNLRYLKAVQDKDLSALAALVPAKKKLAYSLVTSAAPKPTKKSFSRKDIAAGKLVNPPACGFVDTRPSCGEPDPKSGAFQCRCDGGGTHVTYDWQKEGDGFVIVKIDESSS